MENFETSARSRRKLHCHFHPDRSIIAEVRISNRRFTPFDVSKEAGQREVLFAIEQHLGY